MGWRPHEVAACGMGEFLAAFDGWKQFHAPSDEGATSGRESILSTAAELGL